MLTKANHILVLKTIYAFANIRLNDSRFNCNILGKNYLTMKFLFQ